MLFTKRPYYTHPLFLIFLIRWLPLILLLLTFGCVPASINPYLTEWQAESPLIPGTNLTLVENQWRLAEVTYQGKIVAFDAIQPVYYQFLINGVLTQNKTNCNVGSYSIIAESEHRYRLVPGDTTLVYCGDIGNAQSIRLDEAISATTEYELRDNQLFLTGKDVRVVLEIDHPFPLIPGATSSLIQNRWRWVEVTDQGEQVKFGDIEPVYSSFNVGGSLTINPTNCIDGGYEIISESQQHYQLIPRQFTQENCPGNGQAQFAHLTKVLEATTELEVRDNRVFLKGEGVQIILEIDNSD